MRFWILVLLGTLPSIALAQSSTSYRLDDGTLNAGGRPARGQIAISTSFRITLDSLGEPFEARQLSSPSIRMGTGFSQGYLPPGEVAALRWLNGTDLTWNADPASVRYNVYRDALSDLPGTHGECLAANLGDTAYTEPDNPEPGDGFFYLVTSENRLNEEGTRGVQSDGDSRSNLNACP